ncbi:MAG: insulinase family protein [Myxococcales bacterium]|nr:insulinase family protein [Myxococcales bacterium]
MTCQLWSFLLAIALVGCGTPRLTVLPAAYRQTQPAPGIEPPFLQPLPQAARLSSNIDVFVVSRPRLPLVELQLVIEGGRDTDPIGKEGRADLCVNLLEQGTMSLGKQEFDREAARWGVSVGAFASPRHSTLHASFSSAYKEKAFALFRAMVEHPRLREDALARLVQDRQNTIAQEQATLHGRANRIALPALYGRTHPEGRLASATSFGRVTLADCDAFYRDVLRSGYAFYVASGDIAPADLEIHLGTFLSRREGSPARPMPRPSADAGPQRQGGLRVYVSDAPNAVQSVVMILGLGPPIEAPGRVARTLVVNLLGASFDSRLNLNLRESKGWTYGVGAWLDYVEGASGLFVRTQVEPDKTVPALSEMLKELRDLGTHERPLSQEEFSRETRAISGKLPATFETNEGILWFYRNRLVHGLALRDDTEDELAGLTRDEVERQVAPYANLDEMKVVVVGAADLVLPDLCRFMKAGRWGPVELSILDAAGNLLPEPSRDPCASFVPEARGP